MIPSSHNISDKPWLNQVLTDLLGDYHQLSQQPSRSLPQALLLLAPKGTGKQLLGEYIAKRLFCQQPVEQLHACHQCPACILFDSKNHPDFSFIGPDESKQNPTILIKDIRNLINNLSLTAHQKGWKICLIKRADCMNINASNALLKTLEEPTPRTLIILTADSLINLPMTIISRTQIKRIALPSKQESSQWLQTQQATSQKNKPSELTEQQQTARIEQALSLAHNAPLQALSYLTSDFIERYQEWQLDLQKLLNQQLSANEFIQTWEKLKEFNILWLQHAIKQAIETLLLNPHTPSHQSTTETISTTTAEWLLCQTWLQFENDLHHHYFAWRQQLNSSLVLANVLNDLCQLNQTHHLLNSQP